MKRIIKTLIIVLLLFFTLFPINFVFFPSFISTRHIIAICGFVVWLLSIIYHKRKIYNRKFFVVFCISILISFWSLLCTLIFNVGNDYTYVKLPITIAIMFFSAYTCILLMRYFDNQVSFNKVTKYFIYVILLQSFFVLIQFFNNDIANFLFDIQRLTERQVKISTYHLKESSRFIGFGLLFYTASFFYGTALILITFCLNNLNLSSYKKFKLIILYVFIFLIGMGLSRSTIIGAISSFFVFIFPLKNRSINLKRLMMMSSYILLFSIFLVFLISLNSGLLNKFHALTNNAFDFLISYFNEGKLKSESAEGTFDMLVLPQKSITYFYGTGYYELYESLGDYNYSDIGYLRLLYYFGIPGMVLFFWLEVNLLRMAFNIKPYKPIFYSMLFILFVTNIKGLTTLAMISIIYALIQTRKWN